MIQHYLKIALRNILKFKAQNVINVVSIAVSALLLTVVGSYVGKVLVRQPIESMDYFERTCISPMGMMDSGQRSKVAHHSFRSVEKLVFGPIDLEGYSITATRKDGSRWRLDQQACGVQPDLLAWWGKRSEITGEVVRPLAKDEVILTTQMARTLYGDDFSDVRGETVEVHISQPWGGIEETREMRIADVVAVDEARALIQDLGIYIAVDMDEHYYSMQVFFQLRPGCSLNDLKAELAELLELDGRVDEYVVTLAQELEWWREANVPGALIVIGFLILFYIVTVAAYMRMQTQLFRIREREIALRTVVGARRWQILTQLSVEVLLILGAALALTLALNELTAAYLNEHVSLLVKESNWTMDDFTSITLATYAITALLCLATVAFAVRRIRKMQTGLALRMRPQRHSGLRVATITVQMILSTAFIATALIFYIGSYRTMEEVYNIPANDDFYGQCLSIRDTDVDGRETCEQFCARLRQCEEIEELIEVYQDMISFIPDSTILGQYFYGTRAMVFFQTKGNEVMRFYAIEPTVTNPNANPDNCVYVSRAVKENLERGGMWERGRLVKQDEGDPTNTVEIDIAGWFETIPYMPESEEGNYIIWTQTDAPFDHREFVAVPRPGRYDAAMREVKAVYAEVFPERFTLGPKNYRNVVCQNYLVMRGMFSIVYILAAISIITTVAGLYSVISLDTRRRRKEVALRKVHGATRRDILRLFATRYVVILAASFALVAPFTVAFTRHANANTPANLQWWPILLATILITTAITALTIGWKIREVMKVEPVGWLKE